MVALDGALRSHPPESASLRLSEHKLRRSAPEAITSSPRHALDFSHPPGTMAVDVLTAITDEAQ
jgi:hypothetical protein